MRSEVYIPPFVLESERLLDDLTEEQRQGVMHVDGPLLIIAGAGSGKTRVITRRVAYLMSLGIPPTSILAITFTNKAAGEMKSRVSSTLERPLRDFGRLDQAWPIICTFHSLGLRILKHYSSRIGLAPNFSVYDAADQQRLVKEATKAADLDGANFPPRSVHSAISGAKNKLLSVEDFARQATRFPADRHAIIYKHYQKLLDQNNALDFDDLLMRVAFMFRRHVDILKELQQRFQYILIDEYQDTNHAQYIIAHSLAMAHRNICVVGDPDQSIYAWRGADIQNILDFEKDYPDAKIVKLERNYRSTQTVLHIASALIAHNRKRKRKRLWTENPAGEKARLLVCGDEEEEALAVCRHFKQLNDNGHNWGEMAVFYRVNALSRVMEDALRRLGIPYRIARGVDFYHRKEIKDVLAYLRIIVNPDDELSLERIINVPARGISDAAVQRMQAQALANGWNLWQTLGSIDKIPGATARTVNAVRHFLELVRRWQGLAIGAVSTQQAAASTDGQAAGAAGQGRIRALMEEVVRTSGLEGYLKKIGGEELEELANVNELISHAAQFDEENPQATVEDYLAQISLVSDVDTLQETGGAVTLMTLHAAKGLEFPIVAIIGMEEEILPHARVRDHPEQLEEERRLCFVGITRAQELLVLSRAARRTMRGERLPTIGSRFLEEMPADGLEIVDVSGEGFEHESEGEPESSGVGGEFRKGQMVRHAAFGVGRILEISETGQLTRAVVDFTKAGRKTLILEYARLQPGG